MDKTKKPLSVRQLIFTALFAALTTVGAYLRIPTPWSAFTLQVFFVFMAGVMLGPRYGALSQAVYVALGLVGIPVFTGGGGPMYVLQPTFGFLLSYIPAAYIVGRLTCRWEPGFWHTATACAAGLVVIYAIGLPYMAAIINWYLGGSMGIWDILWSGMIVFLPFDALKAAMTAILSKVLLPRLKRVLPART